MARTYIPALLTILSAITLSPAVSARPLHTPDVAVLNAVIARLCTNNSQLGLPHEYSVLTGKAIDAAVQSGKNLPSLKHCATLKYVPHSEIHRIFSKVVKSPLSAGPWTVFHKKYPNATGITSIGMPEYNNDKTKAYVPVSGSCGWTCGSGFMWTLQNVGGKWVFKKAVNKWIS